MMYETFMNVAGVVGFLVVCVGSLVLLGMLLFGIIDWVKDRARRRRNHRIDHTLIYGLKSQLDRARERFYRNQASACTRMNKLEATLKQICKHKWEHDRNRWTISSHICDCTIEGNTAGVVTEASQKCSICGDTRDTPKKKVAKKKVKK